MTSNTKNMLTNFKLYGIIGYNNWKWFSHFHDVPIAQWTERRFPKPTI